MKKELLRFCNVNIEENGRVLLRNINMYLLEGERLGICGLHDSGKSVLAKALCGKLDCDGCTKKSSVFEKAHYISEKENLIDSLTVYENLFLTQPEKRNRFIFDCKSVQKKAREFIHKTGMDLPEDLLVSDLNRAEKVFVQILKAYLERSQLIILDGVTTAWKDEELEELNHLIAFFEQITFVYVCSQNDSTLQICDRVIVMCKRKISSILEYPAIDDAALKAFEYQHYCEEVFQREKSKLPFHKTVFEIYPSAQSVLAVQEGEIVGIIGSNVISNVNFIQALPRFITRYSTLYGKTYKTASLAIKKGIGILDMYNPREQLFDCFSRSYNIDLPLFEKLNTYGWIHNWFFDYVEKDLAQFPGIRDITDEKDTDALRVVLQRLWLVKSKLVLVNYMPAGYHPQDRYAVDQVMDAMAGSNTGIVLILSSVEDGSGLCDRIAVFDDTGSISYV